MLRVFRGALITLQPNAKLNTTRYDTLLAVIEFFTLKHINGKIALKKKDRSCVIQMKKSISTLKAPKAIGPYSQAVVSDSVIYLSGQLGINPETGDLLDGVVAQTEQAMKNAGAILQEVELDYDAVVKTTIFLQDLADFPLVNECYQSFFKGDFPARSCFQVAGLPKGGLVEIELVAQMKK